MNQRLQWRKILLPEGGEGHTALFWAAVFGLVWLCLHYLLGLLFGFRATGCQFGAFFLAVAACLGRELLRAGMAALAAKYTGRRFWAGVGTAAVFAGVQCLLQGGSAVHWSQWLPVLAGSALLTALVMWGGAMTGLLYSFAAQALPLLIPVSTQLPAQLGALLELLLSGMFLLVLDCEFSQAEEKQEKKSQGAAVGIGAALMAVLAVFVCFFSGLLPWQPVAIATGSMEPQISVGDMVIVSKADADAVAVGDVIQFRRDQYTVVHRVVEILEENGRRVYVTKGDANNANDAGTVSSGDVVGKVVATVPYVGRWTLWLHGAAGT